MELFWSKEIDVTEGLIKQDTEKLHDWYSSPNILWWHNREALGGEEVEYMGKKSDCLTLNLMALDFFQTSVTICKPTRYNIPRHLNLQRCRFENLKSKCDRKSMRFCRGFYSYKEILLLDSAGTYTKQLHEYTDVMRPYQRWLRNIKSSPQSVGCGSRRKYHVLILYASLYLC
jgi:hypothetical protein